MQFSTLLKKDTNVTFSLWILQNILKHLFCRKLPNTFFKSKKIIKCTCQLLTKKENSPQQRIVKFAVIPNFGVSTAITLFSRDFPLVVEIGLWTLARKRWTVRQNIQTRSLLSNFLAYINFKSTKKRITFDVEIKAFKIYYSFLNHI